MLSLWSRVVGACKSVSLEIYYESNELGFLRPKRFFDIFFNKDVSLQNSLKKNS